MTTATLPQYVRVSFAHAVVQSLATDRGLDVLHIKGPALDHSLTGVDEGTNGEPVWSKAARPVSSDADVLVRPSHVPDLMATLQRHGWRVLYGFNDGSPFAHASTLQHPLFGYVDVHRSFPGIGLEPDRAFAALWRNRQETLIAGYRCQAPALVAQRLLLLLHAARAGGNWRGDVMRGWESADPSARAEVDHLADLLDATVPLALVTGRQASVRDRREYDLWSGLAQGRMSLARSWVARMRAAPTRTAAVKVGLRLLLPSRRRLEVALGRSPTGREVARAYLLRIRLGASEVVRVIRDGTDGTRGP